MEVLKLTAEIKKNTKERIIAVALDLFSVQGFATVSVRDIGREVGIKESSIYYHFKNKEHILETILARVKLQNEAEKDRFMKSLQVTASIERKPFIASGLYYVEHVLLQDHMYKLIRMLTIEKQRNEQAAEMYAQLLFQWPLQHQEYVFNHMMKAGLMKQECAAELAAEYQSLIVFVFQKYFSGSGEVVTMNKQAAKLELERLLDRFYNRYL
jgi:AcrR family transcriptional regulator